MIVAVIRSLVLKVTRPAVCRQFSHRDRMVRLWVECSHRGGIDALITKRRAGGPRKVKLERVRDLLLPVFENPAQVAQAHWTGVKVHGHRKPQSAVEFGYHSTIRWLHELDYHLRVPRSWPERQNEQERQHFLGQLRARATESRHGVVVCR